MWLASTYIVRICTVLSVAIATERKNFICTNNYCIYVANLKRIENSKYPSKHTGFLVDGQKAKHPCDPQQRQ